MINDGSDNCDYNFGLKNDQKVSHNMILMSRYMGQLHGGRGPINSGKALPPLFGQCPKDISKKPRNSQNVGENCELRTFCHQRISGFFRAEVMAV